MRGRGRFGIRAIPPAAAAIPCPFYIIGAVNKGLFRLTVSAVRRRASLGPILLIQRMELAPAPCMPENFPLTFHRA